MLNTATARAAAAIAVAVLNVEELLQRDREEGQALVEYGLILALIAVVCIAVLVTMGGQINTKFTKISDSLK